MTCPLSSLLAVGAGVRRGMEHPAFSEADIVVPVEVNSTRLPSP